MSDEKKAILEQSDPFAYGPSGEKIDPFGYGPSGEKIAPATDGPTEAPKGKRKSIADKEHPFNVWCQAHRGLVIGIGAAVGVVGLAIGPITSALSGSSGTDLPSISELEAQGFTRDDCTQYNWGKACWWYDGTGRSAYTTNDEVQFVHAP